MDRTLKARSDKVLFVNLLPADITIRVSDNSSRVAVKVNRGKGNTTYTYYRRQHTTSYSREILLFAIIFWDKVVDIRAIALLNVHTEK